jgi:hypothetical protein
LRQRLATATADRILARKAHRELVVTPAPEIDRRERGHPVCHRLFTTVTRPLVFHR